MVIPAFRTGFLAWNTARGEWDGFGGMLDQLSNAVILYDGTGRVLHANAALSRLLSHDSEEREIRASLDAAARDLIAAGSPGSGQSLQDAGQRQVGTTLGQYRIRGIRPDGRLSPNGGALLLIEPPMRPSSDSTLVYAEYGLTPRETQVARMLAAGHSNVDIAERLGVSATTARNHTARVLRKVNARSRTQLHAILYP